MSLEEELTGLERRLARERNARAQAEQLLEEKSRELYEVNRQLRGLLEQLEQRVEARTSELAMALEAAQDASQVKTDLVAMVSHEIRTPMNAVLGMTELLLESTLDAPQREMTKTILNASRGLLVIVNDLLDLNRVESGRLALIRRSFDPAKLLDEVIDTLQQKARLRGLSLLGDCDLDTRDGFVGDAVRVRQVLLNLVSNAINYTTGGEVRVVLASGTSSDRLRYKVIDHGPGMSPSEQRRIFEPFTRLLPTGLQAREGIGLGLALCRQLVELMDGRLGVDSAPGSGSTFWFEIPAMGAGHEASPSKEYAAAGTQPAGRPLRLLVAEDNPANRAVFRLMLEGMGHAVDEVTNGAEALSALHEARYDLVLMDVRMPVMGGLEATRAIRALESRLSGIPIVALTANASAQDREACLAAGMVGFVPKPVDKATLARIVREYGG